MDHISVCVAAKLAALAYLKPETINKAYNKEYNSNKIALESLLESTAEPIFLNDNTSDLQAYIFQFPKTIVLSTRGTNSMTDILVDLNAELVPFYSTIYGVNNTNDINKDPFVHEGMLRQYLVLEDLMIPLIDLMKKNTEDILVCTSHSLGNLSTMAAIVLAGMFPNRIQYIGFGSPRVGNVPFCELFRSLVPATTLIKNGTDCIVKVFPGNVYAHVSDMKLCGRFDNHPSIPLITDLVDHDIHEYIESLSNINNNVRDKNFIDKTLSFVFRTVVDFIHDHQ